METVIYTQRVEIVKDYGERRDCADQRIADYILNCGFLPVPVPNKEELAAVYIETIKPVGIVLTGGNSLVAYEGNAPERDGMDKKLIELAVQYEIPVYGFCRGMQSILDYFGCKLQNVSGHVAVRHDIIYANEKSNVNSFHNQACIKLEENCGLEVVGRAQDGVIEEIKHQVLPIAGTMWHPEREAFYVEKDIKRIKELFKK